MAFQYLPYLKQRVAAFESQLLGVLVKGQNDSSSGIVAVGYNYRPVLQVRAEKQFAAGVKVIAVKMDNHAEKEKIAYAFFLMTHVTTPHTMKFLSCVTCMGLYCRLPGMR